MNTSAAEATMTATYRATTILNCGGNRPAQSKYFAELQVQVLLPSS